jgi:hypothetical protein
LGEGRQPAIRIKVSVIFLANYNLLIKHYFWGYLRVWLGKEKLENLEKERSIDFSASLKDNEIQLEAMLFTKRSYLCSNSLAS